MPRIAAHVVQGHQPVVAVEGRVLHRLGHHRRGELLQPLHEAQLALACLQPRLLVAVQHQCADELDVCGL
jgi:hypothetical protein